MVGGLRTSGLLTPYGKLVVKLAPASAAFATSIFAWFNGLGRPLAGFLDDRFGPVPVMVATYALPTAVFFGLPVLAQGQVGLYLCSALLALRSDGGLHAGVCDGGGCAGVGFLRTPFLRGKLAFR
jgi:OFA family oxalate/formate antiporter-like MFS transporter